MTATAYLLARLRFTDDGPVFDGAMIASQPAGSMASSTKTVYATLFTYPGADFDDASKRLVSALEDHPMFKPFIDIVKVNDETMRASMRAGGLVFADEQKPEGK